MCIHVEHRNFLLCEESPISTLESFLRQSGKDNSVEFDDSVADRIIGKNDAADLQGLRDYLIELYENQRYDALIHMVKTTYHKDILDYLPEEMVNFIEFRKGECHETGRSKYDSPQNVEGYR